MCISLDGDDEGIHKEVLPKYLVTIIDESIAQDFTSVRHVTDKDRENNMYKGLMFTFKSSNIEILYERVVVSDNPYVPKTQFLFGFHPADGLCIFSQNRNHKRFLCDSPIRELANECILTQSLQYVLLESDSFELWSFIPICCSEHENCPLKSRPVEMRKELFQD